MYQANVDDLHEDYIRPQENGSHYDCEYVELNNSRYGIVVSAENAFSFNASYYTQEELEEKTHNYELTESDSVVFCVDYALMALVLTVVVQLYWSSTDLMMYYSGSSLH